MKPIIMDSIGLHRTVIRLSHEIGERNEGFHNIVLVGIKRGGEVVAKRVQSYISSSEGVDLPCAGLDISMTRDDLVTSSILPTAEKNELGFDITGKTVVLCDDVFQTGRSAVAGVEALMQLGRPAKIQLLVLVDRGGRELPIRADFVGKNVPTSKSEYVGVRFVELGDKIDEMYIRPRQNVSEEKV